MKFIKQTTLKNNNHKILSWEIHQTKPDSLIWTENFNFLFQEVRDFLSGNLIQWKAMFVFEQLPFWKKLGHMF